MEDMLLSVKDLAQSLEFLKMSTSHCAQTFSDYPLNTKDLQGKKREEYERTAWQSFSTKIMYLVLELLTTFYCYLAVTVSREKKQHLLRKANQCCIHDLTPNILHTQD